MSPAPLLWVSELTWILAFLQLILLIVLCLYIQTPQPQLPLATFFIHLHCTVCVTSTVDYAYTELLQLLEWE